MEPVEFREIALILAVGETLSFTRAAEKTYISQPALSKIVRKVEKNLGAAIFDRSSSPLRITSEGQRFIEYFRRLEQVQNELKKYCENLRCQKRPDLVIGAPSFFCTYVLPSLVSSFQMKHPDFTSKLIESNDDELRELLRAGVINLALTVEKNMPAELKSFDLIRESIILAVPRANPINVRLQDSVLHENDLHGGLVNEDAPCVSIREFASERFLFLKPGNDIRNRGIKICHEAGFEPQIVMELDQMLTAYYLAEAGLGITFIRASIPHYAGFSPDLCLYRLDYPDTQRHIRVIFNEKSLANGQQKKFIAYLRSCPESL